MRINRPPEVGEPLPVIEGLLKSLNEPDMRLDDIWAEEAGKRRKAFKEGKLEGIPMEDVFQE